MQMEKETTDVLKLSLTRATDKDMQKLIAIESTVKGNRVYSPMLTEEEWQQDLATNEVYLIKQGEK